MFSWKIIENKQRPIIKHKSYKFGIPDDEVQAAEEAVTSRIIPIRATSLGKELTQKSTCVV